VSCRFNELELRWAAYDNFTFSCDFEAPPELLAEAAVLLHCDGLDTGEAGQRGGEPTACSRASKVGQHR